MTPLQTLTLSITSACVVAVALFVVRQNFFSPRRMTGTWYARLVTRTTAYKPFVGMERTFILLLTSDGKAISGTGEIVREHSSARTENLVGERRVRVAVDGKVSYGFPFRQVVALHVVETGRLRDTSSFWEFELTPTIRAKSGRFTGTAGDQVGVFTLQREPFVNE